MELARFSTTHYLIAVIFLCSIWRVSIRFRLRLGICPAPVRVLQESRIIEGRDAARWRGPSGTCPKVSSRLPRYCSSRNPHLYPAWRDPKADRWALYAQDAEG
jgi:hypothetical protein